MKLLAAIALLIFLPFWGVSQDCQCPGKKSNKNYRLQVFTFSNKTKLITCGSAKDSIYARIRHEYAGFSLYKCGENNPIEKWDDYNSSRLYQDHDTLIVEVEDWLPIGQNFDAVVVPFFIHKFVVSKAGIEHRSYYRNDLTKYTPKQINDVLAKFHRLAKGDDNSVVEASKMLFWAYVSGSSEAEVCLRSVTGKFGPLQSVAANELKSILFTYSRWKEKNESK